ncbi:putative Snf2 family helicase [Tetraselmis virus 1]|uniref:Putative Snf2 family helicase n=1 Tax=Tetraselmis virus 1 TaxID=2060617 RepID=A0A2P0VMK9_9VIRU|nr:putative Snf2 family helicase [Tetraselmis virus 1]AUF82131.1 putative Snf2 family helicase [Tetraselmis virus 1]
MASFRFANTEMKNAFEGFCKDKKMFPHQLDVVQKIIDISKHSNQTLIIGEMGIGKTVIGIASVCLFPGKRLIVCPKVACNVWKAHIEAWCSLKTTFVVTGTKDTQITEDADIYVMTPSILRNLHKNKHEFLDKQFSITVYDEIHSNGLSTLQSVTNAAGTKVKAGFKLGLTGTPLNNHVCNELIAMSLCLGVYDEDVSHGKAETVHQDLRLRSIVCTREQAKIELPVKTVSYHKIGITEEEAKSYNRALKKLHLSPKKLKLKYLGELRMNLMNPHLIGAAEDPRKIEKAINEPSSYIKETASCIIEMLKTHQKVVFAHEHVTVAKAVIGYMERSHGIMAELFCGSLDSHERESMLERFRVEPEFRVIAMTKAGNMGISLVQATGIVICPGWNPHSCDQMTARIHRIGQMKPVEITYVYGSHPSMTIEDHIIEMMHTYKRDCSDAFVHNKDIPGERESIIEILQQLKTGDE